MCERVDMRVFLRRNAGQSILQLDILVHYRVVAAPKPFAERTVCSHLHSCQPKLRAADVAGTKSKRAGCAELADLD
jgi:hypothetical protein